MPKPQGAAPRPPGTEAMFSVTCKDVVMGRGSGTQNHCGNVTYRKLVFLNKELYATSSKFDKLKISKAIVAAVREFGGHFVQADDKRGGLYFDIGDKRAWDKTSQALREGQSEVRARLAKEDPSGMEKVAEYKQVISEQTFFAYACRMLESLYHPAAGEATGIAACGQQCPHARRRQTLNRIGADPSRIHIAMQSFAPPSLPPTQVGQPLPPGYNGMPANSMEPLPFNAPAPGGDFEPLPYQPTSGATAVSAPSSQQADPFDPLPFQPKFSSGKKPVFHKPPEKMGNSTDSKGSVFSLRQFCSEDMEMSSKEGKILMAQLNQEVDDLIRRKSQGLIAIDTTLAFDDLVFEEDSMMIDETKEVAAHPERPRNSSSSSDRHSSISKMSNSGLSFKDDISLMNMSILTLDEKDIAGSNREGSSISTPKEGGPTPKSVLRDTSGPTAMRNRNTRVSFAGKNISLMSMDDKSFSHLVDSISDPDGSNVAQAERTMSELSGDSQKSVSRKMGFPMRPKMAQKWSKPPSVVGKEDETVSSLTIAEDFPPRSAGDLSQMAAKVAGNGKIDSNVLSSLTAPGASISNVSALNVGSNMSLASDIDPELLK